jgi:hypothetical protein
MKRIYLSISFVCFILVLFSFAFLLPKVNKVLAATVTLNATADTMIKSDYPNSGSGENTLIHTSRITTAKSRVLARFDLGSIPSNATVTSATFSIYFSSCGRLSLAVDDLNIARITGAWSESGATWNTHKDKFDAASALHKTAPCGSTGKYLNYDVKMFVDNWRNNTWANYGLGLYGDESPTTEQWEKIFYSKEYDSNHPPKLTVAYTLSNQPATGDGGAGVTTPGSDQSTSGTTADQNNGLESSEQAVGNSGATSAAKKATPSSAEKEQTGISTVRAILLAVLILLLIAVVTGYIVYRRRKNKLPK